MKTDKELAVELAISYIRAWFSRENALKGLNGEELKSLITDAYFAIHSLPDGDRHQSIEE